jgi:SET and MYND domain-containing protein
MTGGGVDKKGEGSRSHAEAADASAAAAAALGLGDGYDAVDTLEHHWEETPPARKAQLAQMAMLTCGFMAGILSSANDGGGGAGDVPSGTDADADVAATDATDAPDAAAGDAADANPAGTEAAGAKAAGTEDADPLSGGPDPRDVAKLLARFSCNLHTVCDEELKPLGIACYPAASMLNHSCRPTCAQTFVGKKVVFRCPQTPLPLNPTQTLIYKS